MKPLTKKLFRTIMKTRGQSLAVAAVVLCGTACFICLVSVHRNLLLTRDTYYAQYRFADFEIMLERAPNTTLFKLENIPGVRQVRGRIVEEVNLDLPGRTGRLVSLPNRAESPLNDIVVRKGRYFSEGAQNEVIVSERFAQANHFSIGDILRITVDGKRHALKIVGEGLSPEYVILIRSVQDMVPAPERFGILWVPQDFAETALSMSAAYNNVVGSVDDPEQLDAILDRCEDVLDSYGIFAKIKQKNQISASFVADEIRGLEVMARIMPTVFLGIAALVIFILLSRMVRNERTLIGLMKAYGYSNLSVATHYVLFSLILSAVGCVGGFAAGHAMAGGMLKMYAQFYQFPLLRSQVYPDIVVKSLGIAILFAFLGSLSASIRASRIRPADAMRPEAPVIGHRVLLESWGWLWVRMGFTWKMIARNVSRSRFRASLNAFGVMISSGIIIMGFFSLDGIQYMLSFQFELAEKEDVKISFAKEMGKAALHESARIENVLLAEPLLQYPFEMRNGWKKKDVVVIGMERDGKLRDLMNTDEEVVDVGERGLVLSETIAEQLGVGVGDFVTLKPLMGRITKERTASVSKVVKQYFGASAYMNINALSRILGEPFAMNAALLDTEPGMERSISDQLNDAPFVSAVEVKVDALESLMDTIGQNIAIMTGAILTFSGVIAFSIIYNVTLVSLAERQRELASLRVMGFTHREVGSILYNENFVTGAIGLILGIPFGMTICRLMVNAFQTDLYRMPYHIAPRTFIIATVLTVVFIAISNFAVRNKIHGLDMVEVLKARE